MAGCLPRFLFWMTLNWAIALAAYYLMILAFFPAGAMGLGSFLSSARRRLAARSHPCPVAVGTFEGAIVGALTLFHR